MIFHMYFLFYLIEKHIVWVVFDVVSEEGEIQSNFPIIFVYLFDIFAWEA